MLGSFTENQISEGQTMDFDTLTRKTLQRSNAVRSPEKAEQFLKKDRGGGGWAKGKHLETVTKFSHPGVAFAASPGKERKTEKQPLSREEHLRHCGLRVNTAGDIVVQRKKVITKSNDKLKDYCENFLFK